jgi:hypothetical protein
MKKLLLGLLCTFAMGAYAQDTVKKSNNLGDLNEQYMVLKSDKNVKQGSYKLFADKKMVASGNYDKGKRTGTWSFYTNDELTQQYDYTANKIVTDIPDRNITCEIDDATAGDAVKKAVKVGGYSSIKLMAAIAKFDDAGGGSGPSLVTHVLSVDANGKLTSWSASVKNADGVNIVHPPYTDLPDEVAQFIPATLNGQKVACIITVHVVQKGEASGPDFSKDGATKHGGSGKKKATP